MKDNPRAHLAWGATGSVSQTAQNRLKPGPHREDTVSDDLLESQRLPRTDGGDLTYICSVARRGAISQTLKITKDPFRVSIPIIKKIVLVY